MAKLYCVDGTIEEVSPKNGTDFSLEELNGFVEGWIETLYLGNDKIMVINEEGKLEGLDYNPIATRIFRESYGDSDYIVGNALVCSSEEIK